MLNQHRKYIEINTEPLRKGFLRRAALLAVDALALCAFALITALIYCMDFLYDLLDKWRGEK